MSTQFDSLLTQIGQLAGDSGFNGINLLAGDTLTVTLNETGSFDHRRDRRRLYQRHCVAAEHRQRGQQLGRRHRYHRGIDRL